MTALNADAHQRVFSCTLTTIESVFDFLNNLVARGDVLLSAFVIDGSVRTTLPLAAFDGLPTTTAIQAMIDDWTSILDTPRSINLTHQQVLIELTRRRLRSQQARQVWLKEMIEHYSQWQHWVVYDVRWSARQRRVTHRYATQLALHQTELAHTRRAITALTNRLTHLAAGVGVGQSRAGHVGAESDSEKRINLLSLIDSMHPSLRSELVDHSRLEDALKIQKLLAEVYGPES